MLTIVGNGTSRVMPTYGEDRFWGCNAFYRDANPEILFTVDIPMQREVIEWGYAEANKIAVGDWEVMPIDMLEPLKMGFGNTEIIESISRGCMQSKKEPLAGGARGGRGGPAHRQSQT